MNKPGKLPYLQLQGLPKSFTFSCLFNAFLVNGERDE